MTVRKARCWVMINGIMIPAMKTHVTRKSKRSADTFSADLSVTKTEVYGMGLAEWADFQPTDVQIINGMTSGEQISMVTGQIDTPLINWTDMTVAISGRDKSASLIEKRSSKKYPNNKVSDVVSAIAQAHGLTAVVSSSDNLAGKVYNKDTTHLVIHKTDFEAMSDLAESVGFRWYVDGTNLVFEPKDSVTNTYIAEWFPPGTQQAYTVATITDLKTFRNMTAAKPHTVSVKSWHHEKKQQFLGQKNAGGVGDQIDIDHHHNGRTQDQVDRLSSSRLKDAVRHDCNVTFAAPADLSVNARMQCQLVGTGTIYDQLYDIDSLDIDVAWGTGGVMSLECKAPKQGRQVDE